MIVVKVGGGEGIAYEALCDDLATLSKQGEQFILVHGGNALTNQVATALGHPPVFIDSPSGYASRLTDRRTLEIFTMVYCGRLNKMLVEMLQGRGLNAVGLSGLDGALWRGERKRALRAVENGRLRLIRDTYTGRVEQVNADLLRTLLGAGYLPVLTPPALSYENEAINVDGDRAAALTAATLGARDLLLLSNVPGLLRDYLDPGSLIGSLSLADLEGARESYARGRMRVKLLAAQEALLAGVGRVVIGAAQGPAPIQGALAGSGTQIWATGREQPG